MLTWSRFADNGQSSVPKIACMLHPQDATIPWRTTWIAKVCQFKKCQLYPKHETRGQNIVILLKGRARNIKAAGPRAGPRYCFSVAMTRGRYSAGHCQKCVWMIEGRGARLFFYKTRLVGWPFSHGGNWGLNTFNIEEHFVDPGVGFYICRGALRWFPIRGNNKLGSWNTTSLTEPRPRSAT